MAFSLHHERFEHWWMHPDPRTHLSWDHCWGCWISTTTFHHTHQHGWHICINCWRRMPNGHGEGLKTMLSRKRRNHIVARFGPFWPRSTIDPVVWCLPLRSGRGGTLSWNGRWLHQAYSFASRLTPKEKRYAHLDKEALAIIFGVTGFLSTWLVRCPILFQITGLYSTCSQKRSQCQQWHRPGFNNGPWPWVAMTIPSGINQDHTMPMLLTCLADSLYLKPPLQFHYQGKPYCYWRSLQHLQSQSHRSGLPQLGTPCCQGWQNWYLQVGITRRIILSHLPFKGSIGNYQSMMVF